MYKFKDAYVYDEGFNIRPINHDTKMTSLLLMKK